MIRLVICFCQELRASPTQHRNEHRDNIHFFFSLTQMASNILKLRTPTIKLTKPTAPLKPLTRTLFPSQPTPYGPHHHNHYEHHHLHLSLLPHKQLLHRSLFLQSSLSSYTPPTTKEEAILQAKTCLSTTLEKPLNNPRLAAGKLRKQNQPRFRIEIPVVDDSVESLSQLALQVLGDLPIRRKGSPLKILILWPDPTSARLATKAFESLSSKSNQVEQIDLSSITDYDDGVLNSADVAVFLAPEASKLDVMKAATDSIYPKPVVVFNPNWAFEEESGFGELSRFVRSFEVVYSFMGLEVRGVLSKKRGMVFRCVKDGVLSGEKWEVLVEEGGELKVISRFNKRPSIGEVENVLYNMMAANSPMTKSAKFLRDLVSNVRGKK
ncbi:uncharacterized protein LOC122062679 [Macadamia integrifolia]|uniref:uncharacterized protein LOC122062679 n=1 Tax=Macadamia integrifolia TaxID=60698 RepID=UPI001C4FEC67|nr:uncharacterized protein LOC122062679 [Macadamia integrifolia]